MNICYRKSRDEGKMSCASNSSLFENKMCSFFFLTLLVFMCWCNGTINSEYETGCVQSCPYLLFNLAHTWCSILPILSVQSCPYLVCNLAHTWSSVLPILGLQSCPYLVFTLNILVLLKPTKGDKERYVPPQWWTLLLSQFPQALTCRKRHNNMPFILAAIEGFQKSKFICQISSLSFKEEIGVASLASYYSIYLYV